MPSFDYQLLPKMFLPLKTGRMSLSSSSGSSKIEPVFLAGASITSTFAAGASGDASTGAAALAFAASKSKAAAPLADASLKIEAKL